MTLTNSVGTLNLRNYKVSISLVLGNAKVITLELGCVRVGGKPAIYTTKLEVHFVRIAAIRIVEGIRHSLVALCNTD